MLDWAGFISNFPWTILGRKYKFHCHTPCILQLRVVTIMSILGCNFVYNSPIILLINAFLQKQD